MSISFRRKAASLLFTFVCLLTFALITFAKSKPPQSHPLTPADVVDKVSGSLVRVEARFSFQIEGENSPQSFVSSGTGFVVDSQGRIATANHVIDAGFNQHQVEAQLARNKRTLLPGSFHPLALNVVVLLPNINGPGMIYYANTEHLGATLLTQNSLLDIAILNCEANLVTTRAVGFKDTRTLPQFQDATPRSGDPVTIVGFPAIIMGNRVTQIPGPTTNSGTVSNPFVIDELGRSVILLDLRANHGDSGGPAFNSQDGRIIGFVDEGYAASDGQYSGLVSIIPIREILNLLPNQTEIAGGQSIRSK